MVGVEQKFTVESDIHSRTVDVEFDFEAVLNSDTMLRELKRLQHKQVKVPTAPSFLAEECVSSDNNEPVIILSWHQKLMGVGLSMTKSSSAQGYVLEVDDGTAESGFKQVYCGPDSMCQLKGLESNKVYNARVKAYNQAGVSEYSHVISIPATPSMCLFSPCKHLQ